jgi:hypothetical protein
VGLLSGRLPDLPALSRRDLEPIPILLKGKENMLKEPNLTGWYFKHAFNYALSVGDSPAIAEEYAKWRCREYPEIEHTATSHTITRPHFLRQQEITAADEAILECVL